MRAVTCGLQLLVVQAALAGDLTRSQQLVVACYKVQVERVVACLREGADVNATMGERAYETPDFHDRWTGGLTDLGADSWTPLMALASSPELPDPPIEAGEIWRDREKASELQKQVPQSAIDKRENDVMLILQILLSHRCELERHDGFGATALFMSVDNDKPLMTKTMLEFGATPNTKTKTYIDGPGDITPLHVACDSRVLLELLLEHGADGDARDSGGNRPAEWVNRDSRRTFDLVKTAQGWRVHDREK